MTLLVKQIPAISTPSADVGGARRCIDRVVNDDRLEVCEVEPPDGVTWNDDTVNPKPDERYP
jgi:hypothetical protein